MSKLLGAAMCLGITLGASAVQGKDCRVSSDLWPYDYKKEAKNADILVYADLYLERSCERIMAEAKAGSTATIYGISADVVEAIASAQLNDKRTMLVDGDLTVAGYVVGDFEHSVKTSIEFGDRFSFPIDLNDSKTFLVGPIPVKVQYGMVGEAGMDYLAELSAGAIQLGTDPFVDTNVYVNSKVDVAVAKVEATGKLILVNDQMNNQITLELDQVDFDRIYVDAIGQNDVRALEGSVTINAFADIMGNQRDYSKNLFSWNGFERQDQMFRVDLEYPLEFGNK